MKKNLDTIIEDEKKNFHKQTFATILKEWGAGFAKLSQTDKFNAMKEILKLAGIELGGTPQEGLAIKIAEGRRRDTDTQERIKYAQSWNLAATMVAATMSKSISLDYREPEELLEKWQPYFLSKLSEGNQTNE